MHREKRWKLTRKISVENIVYGHYSYGHWRRTMVTEEQEILRGQDYVVDTKEKIINFATDKKKVIILK